MNATTVNQFATRANALAYAIETLGGKADRLRALSLWLLKSLSGAAAKPAAAKKAVSKRKAARSQREA
jgi:hypothetical protein